MSIRDIIKSTGIVAFSTFISRIMGFVRDMIIARYFGASGALDGFFVAFRIPNLLRRLVAEGSLTISFIPVYTDYQINRGDRDALALAQKTLSILVVVLLVFVCLGEIFSPQIVRLFAYGFTEPERIALTVDLNRVMFPYLFLVGLVAFAMGVLNSHGYFFAPAFSPVLMNVGFITGAVVFSRFFDEPLFGLAWGVIAGGVLQLLLQIPYLARSGFRVRASFDIRHPGIRAIFRLLVPALFGIAIYQINLLMSTMLASMLPQGCISYLYYSDRLIEFTLGVFIISIGNVILPEMSKMSARDDMEGLKRLYVQAIRSSLFISIPASVGLAVAGFPIVSVLFTRGEFTFYHADMTSRALFFASMGIASLSVLRITTPTYYSLKDTKTPVLCSALSFVVNIVLGYLLMQTGLRHAGLTLANAIAVTIQTVILLVVLSRKVGGIGLSRVASPVCKHIASAAVMGVSVYFISSAFNWQQPDFAARLVRLAMLMLVGGVIYGTLCYFAKVEEIRYFRDRLVKAYRGAREKQAGRRE